MLPGPTQGKQEEGVSPREEASPGQPHGRAG